MSRRASQIFGALALVIVGVKGECSIVQSGTSSSSPILLYGTILTPAGALRRGNVLVSAPAEAHSDQGAQAHALTQDSGSILYVGDGCDDGIGLALGGETPFVVECDSDFDVISPGWINTHEHIEYSTVAPFPRDEGAEHQRELFSHRHDWRVGMRGHHAREAPVNGTEEDATRWGELRHLFSGTTSIVGGEMVPGLVRNLNWAEGLESGLYDSKSVSVDTWDVFPLDDGAGILRVGDCDYGPDPVDSGTAAGLHRYLAHVAEGVDLEARNEFRCLSDATFDTDPMDPPSSDASADWSKKQGLSTDILGSNVALVHALGLSETDFDLVAARGAKVVWSPRSNVYLYGTTFDIKYALEAGVTVALGTDWLPSGSATMAREAVCAWQVTGRSLSPKKIWDMMTRKAADVAGFEDKIGSIEKGMLADLVIYSGGTGEVTRLSNPDEDDLFAQAIFASPENIELVLRGGKVMLASKALESLAGASSSSPSSSRRACESVQFGPTAVKSVCVSTELGSSFSDFKTKMADFYPAILPGVPLWEPSCEGLR